MSNKYFNNDTAPSKQSGGQGGGDEAACTCGRRPILGLPNKTAAWPGVPGGTQSKSRSAGYPTEGPKGPFYVKKVGL